MKHSSGHWTQDAFKEMEHLAQSQMRNKKKFHFCLLVKQASEGISIFSFKLYYIKC